MSELEIVTYPAPILKQKTLPINDIDEKLERLMDDMAETMYAAPGLGLAAVQVGVNLSLLIYDIVENDKHNLQVLINPRIITREGSMIYRIRGMSQRSGFQGRRQARRGGQGGRRGPFWKTGEDRCRGPAGHRLAA